MYRGGNIERDLHATIERQLDISLLQSLLDTQLLGIGQRLVFVPTIDSTNTQAMRMTREGSSDEGMVILTNNQTAGKGRLGRHWFDRAGCNVLSSTILWPCFPPYLLVMIASLAAVETIAEVCHVAATIKWPNDVLIDDQKVAGILIETSSDPTGRLVAIMGVGVNVNGHISQLTQPESIPLHTTATTVEAACGHPVSREAFIARLLHHLEEMYLALQEETRDPATAQRSTAARLIQERWRSQLSTLGRTVQVRQGDQVLTGIAEDVNDKGELLLRSYTGTRSSITWGDIGYPTE